MKEPERIPLTDNPRNKEPQKIKLLPQVEDDIWDIITTNNSPQILAKKNEDTLENNSQSIQELESD